MALSASAITEKNLVSSTDPVVWLVEIKLSGSLNPLRFANYDVAVTWQSQTWYPFPFAVSPIQRSADGRLSDISISIDNANNLAMGYADADLIQGQPVRIVLISTNALGTSDALFEVLLESLQFEADEMKAVLRCGLPNVQERAVPGERFFRTRCRYLQEYGDPTSRCAYDLSLPGALPTCDGGLNTTNGCAVHGADEVARGLTRLHPRRFGGFPGILKGNAG